LSWTDKTGNFWLFSGTGDMDTGILNTYFLFNDVWEYQPSTTTLPPATTPIFSRSPGTYPIGAPLTISNGMANASFHYTTDGTTPTANSNLYSGSLTIPVSETIQAVATAPGYRISGVGAATYIARQQVAKPVFSVAAGTYSSPRTVSISDSTKGSTIYYIVSSHPEDVETYTTPLKVLGTMTIKAIGAASGYLNSEITTAAYTFQAALPIFSPAPGTYTSPQTVTISDNSPGSIICYRTDGSTPVPGSMNVYSTPLKVGQSITFNAIAWEDGYTSSGMASATYTINLSTAAAPVFKPAGGTYTSAQSVTITDASAGAAIYYTLDGSAPSATHGTKYAGAIAVKATETINAIAVGANYKDSAISTASYTMHLPQTITFAQPASPVSYGAKPIALTATANSGLAVTLSVVSGPGTLNGNALTITGAGSVVVAANQAGNSSYAAAAQVSRTIVASKAVLTATAAKQAMIYGGTLPGLTYTLTGFVNGDSQGSAATGSAALTAAAKANSPVGSYTITVAAGTLAARNYSFKFANGTLTVTKAALTVTANNLTMKQGGTAPALTYSIAGLVNGDMQAKAVTGAPKLATTATAKSTAGSYPITVSAGTLAAANYSFGFVNGTMTVTK